MITNTAITIYNRYYDKTSGYDKWQRTVIDAAHWFGKTKTAVATTGLIAANEYKIRIPSPIEGFVHPEDWPSLQAKSGHWTLQPGDKVVKGESDQEISKAADLKDAATILAWGDNRRGLNPHWVVIGA